MPPKFTIALSLDIHASYWRDVLAGVHRHIRLGAPWNLRWTDREQGVYSSPGAIPADGLDGVICGRISPKDLKRFHDAGVRVVSTSNYDKRCGAPRVVSDDIRAGELAADALLNRGFRSFGYVGYKGHHYADLRGSGFAARLRASGVPHELELMDIGEPGTVSRDLAAWLPRLRKPCGVFVANDLRARAVLDACRKCSLAVPFEIAAIGVDNDFLQNMMSPLPLSSVQLDGEEVGFQAARLLGRLLDGASPEREVDYVPPKQLLVRESSDILAVTDTSLVKALEWMRGHFTEPGGVEEVVRASGLSRRVLERRFQRHFGRTPSEHLHELRLERARELLAVTDRSVGDISGAVGFDDPRSLISRFKKRFGQTPAAYRRSR